ncbi:MAG: rhodanese-like domain-containing protein [Thermodesulfobacteriota bacterium]|nr:rhodanese-like domain-containing protein [Thermodesulfobacteriota bacterium]
MPRIFTCSEDTVNTISPKEVWDIICGDRNGEYVIVDVRTPSEYEEGHLPGAVLIPLNELDRRYTELEREKQIIIYCRSGRRSFGGAILLCNQGIRKIYNMKEGVLGWPYEKVKGSFTESEELFKDIREIKELLIFAIQMERSTQIFYYQAAQNVEEKEVVEMLNKLYHVEQEHMENLNARLREVWPEAPPLEKIWGSEYIEGAISFSQALVTMEDKPPHERIDILEIALENECKAFDLYKRMGARVGEPLKDFFIELAEQEREHIDVLTLFL